MFFRTIKFCLKALAWIAGLALGLAAVFAMIAMAVEGHWMSALIVFFILLAFANLAKRPPPKKAQAGRMQANRPPAGFGP